jgi:hypothetical protein
VATKKRVEIPRKFDFVAIAFLIFLGYLYSMVAANHYLGKTIFGGTAFMLPSVIYMGLRSPKPWKKILLGALIFGCLFGFFFEFFQDFNKTYIFANTLFPKLFGMVPLDKVIGHFEMALLTFTFYEHFVDKKSNYRISPRSKESLLLGVFLSVLIVAFYYLSPGSLSHRYPYFYSGIVAIMPLFIYVYHHPKSVRDLMLMVPFFFFLYFMMEISAMQHTWWIFEGNNYIGWVRVFNINFPFEDLLFWMLLYAATITTYYKIFIEKVYVRRLAYARLQSRSK